MLLPSVTEDVFGNPLPNVGMTISQTWKIVLVQDLVAPEKVAPEIPVPNTIQSSLVSAPNPKFHQSWVNRSGGMTSKTASRPALGVEHHT